MNREKEKDKQSIEVLTDKDIGKWVIYKPDLENEKGRIKSFDNNKKIAWIVYKANGNWDLDHWKDYTGVSTKYEDLILTK